MIFVLYRPDSEHERAIREFTRHLDSRRVPYTLVDVDSREGSIKAQNYGIMQYPATLAIRSSDGAAIQIWAGQLPLISEVEFFARNSV